MSDHNRFSSQTAFIFAAAAAAVGLGNIWRFPYFAGQNGGGAFVLLYLIMVLLLGLPLMVSEVVVGRLGRRNPIGAFAKVAIANKHSRHWGILGGITVIASFLILSYYVVIAGWVLDYFYRLVIGQFHHATELDVSTKFNDLLSHPGEMILCTTLIMVACVGVISLGIKRGLERTVMWMFPTLIILMLILLGYALTTPNLSAGFHFLFKPNFHEINGHVVLMALGQAFFSLNIAMGITVMFSAYLPTKTPIISSVIAIVIADTSIAILAGMIIFPIVFTNHLTPSAGPSLIFRTLPLAFGSITLGGLVGALFFLLLLFAAFTSAISLLEVTAAWLVENHTLKRQMSVYLSALVCWILSLGTVFSFSHEHIFHILNMTFYQIIDFITAGIMLPVGGLLTAYFCGWLIPAEYIKNNLGWNTNSIWFHCWRYAIRYFAPIAIILILFSSLGLFK